MFSWMQQLSKITFAREQYFNFFSVLFLAILGLIALLVFKRLKRFRQAHDSKQRAVGPDLIWILFSVLTGLMIVALAGPKIDTFRILQSNDNLDIIIAVDKSVSMAVEDIVPSRHEVMIREIAALVGSSAVRDGDRLTIFTFSEKASWRMPLSYDREEFLDKLLEIEHPKDRVYYDRSQLYTYFAGLFDYIPKVLEEQDKLFQQKRFKGLVNLTSCPKVILIFSDGDNIDRSLNVSLKNIAAQGIKTYTVGIGTPSGGVLDIKIPDTNSPKQLVPVQVQSKLNMKALDLVKDKTDGKSYIVSSFSSQVQSFLATALAENRKPTLTLVPTGEAEKFWWDFLAIPSLTLVLLKAWRFTKH